MKPIIYLSVLMLMASVIAGQRFDRNSLLSPAIKTSVGTGGLLDPDRFSVSHSYSVNYSSGTSGGSCNGLYLSTIRYKFSVPVTLRLDMGYANQLDALFNKTSVRKADKGSFIMPSVEIKYHPFKNTLIKMRYFNTKGLSSGLSPYQNPGYENMLFTSNSENLVKN